MGKHIEKEYRMEWLARLAAGSVAGLLAVAAVQPVAGQVPRVTERVEKAAKAAPAEVREEAREAAQETREAAREATAPARRAAGEPAREAREAVREGRQEAREIRREGRVAAREARDLANARPADIGLWFNSRAGADGLVIADIAAEGAVSKIGFQEGDRIVSVNGQKVASEREFMRYILADDIRTQKVKVVVFRDGSEQTVYVQPSMLVTEIADYDPLWRYGIAVDDRYPDRIVIQRVYPRTPAYYAGLRSGDVVVSLRGERIGAVADLVRAFSDGDDRVALQVSRGNRTRDLEIDANFDSDVRTSLRPNLDAGVRVEGDADARTPAPANDRPSLDRPRTEKPATPAIPATPAPKGTLPQVPEAPDAPAVPEAPKLPAVPRLP